MWLKVECGCFLRKLPCSILVLIAAIALYATPSCSDELPQRDGAERADREGQPPSLSGHDHAVEAARAPLYEAQFQGMARSIIGRQGDPPSQDLKNNKPGAGTISPGSSDYWRFPSSELHGSRTDQKIQIPPGMDTSPDGLMSAHMELKRQAADPLLHITLSVCTQPAPSNFQINSPPPQLDLLVSWKNPRPGTGDSADTSRIPVVEGYGRYDNPMSNDVFIAVQAPSSTDYSGAYTYEIAGSIDTPYADYQDSVFLHALDSDSGSGLLITSNFTSNPNMTSQWMELGPRFSIFAHNSNDTQIGGLRRSFCGLKNYAQIRATAPTPPDSQSSIIETGLTTIGGGMPKQQFYIGGLNRSSTYFAFLGLESNYSKAGQGNPSGGGTVWKSVNLTTKNDSNCRIVHNLTFCTNVNYAVPARPDIPYTQLGQMYDDYAQSLYTNFSYSMQQIPCNASSDSRYSLAVTCDDCTAAYKQWLCAVTMPRCMDLSSSAPYLQIRNVAQKLANGTDAPTSADANFNDTARTGMATNSSRSPWIDSTIQPGPYKELLPCESLCYGLVQSCPAALQFACPSAGKYLEKSYGRASMDHDLPTCNLPGAIWGVSGAQTLRPLALPALATTVLLLLWHSA